MQTLKEKFTSTIAAALRTRFGYENAMETPRIIKVTLNARVGKGRDAKFADTLVDSLRRITGQQPVKTMSRKSIAGFKLREGQVLGAMVTLRGDRMWHFLEKTRGIAFPRIRDFRGLPMTAVDRDGNFNFTFMEHTAFPEIRPDEVESLHALQVTVTTTAKNYEEGMELFSSLGFPFAPKESKN